MLMDTDQSDMDDCGIVSPIITKDRPFLLCKLCHCEFTNFKEHVTSLVHLDARNKSSYKQSPKHKSDDTGNEGNAKKPKIADEENIIVKDDSESDKGSTNRDGNANGSECSTTAPAKETVIEENGAESTKSSQVAPPTGETNTKEKKERTSGKFRTVTKKQRLFVQKAWLCNLCVHIHRTEDEAFEEHALTEDHKTAHGNRMNLMKREWAWRKNRKWLYICNACQYFANDKAAFVTHIQTETHDAKVAEVVETCEKIKEAQLDKLKASPKPAKRPTNKTVPPDLTAPPKIIISPAAPNKKKRVPAAKPKGQKKSHDQQSKNPTATPTAQTNRPKQMSKFSQRAGAHAAAKKNVYTKTIPALLKLKRKETWAAPNNTAYRNPIQNNQQGKPQQKFVPNPASKFFNQNQGGISNAPRLNQLPQGKSSLFGDYRPTLQDGFNREDRLSQPLQDGFNREDRLSQPISRPGYEPLLPYQHRSQANAPIQVTPKFNLERLSYPEPRRYPMSPSAHLFGFESNSRRLGLLGPERVDRGFSKPLPLLETPVGNLRSDSAPYRGPGQDLRPHMASRTSSLPANAVFDLASNSSLRFRDERSRAISSCVPRYGNAAGPMYNQENSRKYTTPSLFQRR